MSHLRNILVALVVALFMYVLTVAVLISSMSTRAIGLGAVLAIALEWTPLGVGVVAFAIVYVLLARRKLAGKGGGAPT